MTYNFFATLSRMKYIERWALMRNAREETLSEHTLDVAMIAHALCVIGNKRFGKSLNADRAALIGLYHDASEIITGDMPPRAHAARPRVLANMVSNASEGVKRLRNGATITPNGASSASSASRAGNR